MLRLKKNLPGGHSGLEVSALTATGRTMVQISSSAKLTFEEKFSLHQAKMVRTLKSTWVTGVGKIPAMTSSRNLTDVEEPVLKWSGKGEK